ncbi:NAD-dependent epimerase/dehydratase family protein [Deinococcus peraridilitoris]|uniref:Nucleoside-diphosphate-sugar epimerase n=1 Tax=Deinococcus peraridilitoris (strain DSM 19664 / LMG 22246 / CIP 109416 / KR-200) TaxID=937777 RepID=L0A4P9_DEIPD|nr:NAD-dependent epimerase/dehydratase family protein [Deinococcus peraridilitoris]AFZ68132.1 nucleoside-diphosphate-sugar epimerase [Deinococcus peraridilitoris DSM 19664]
MRLLVLGGTQFVGKHIVLTALSRGHEVSIFTRGQQPDDLPEQVQRLRGDRDGDLGALEGGQWDAVIDVSGYVPRVVRQSAQALKEATSRYLFISTVSVYAGTERQDEDAPLATLEDPAVEEVTGSTYGGLKVLCEEAVREVYGERATVVRPGLVVGPFDHTDRFTFWIQGLAGGEEFALFGSEETPFQVIDARDLAAFVVGLLERDLAGTFNAVGERLNWGEVVRAVQGAQSTPVRARFLDDAALEQSGLNLPLAGGSWGIAMRAPDERAVTAGLTRRPLTDTVRDTLAWVRESGRDVKDFGLTHEKKAELLGH